ncbi:MAG: 50S ribosomal protein L19 [Candidatus Paceibacter sp.]|nr:50S ribosomal protein L19 [Candidatus Paceibacter sp.]
MSVNVEQRKNWNLKPGNTVKVWQKIKEGEKFRLQAFEGMIIAHKHGAESGATFTVRKISDGVGVERIFPLFSPNIEKVDLVRESKARRAKLYYVRTKAAKDIRKKMKHLKAEGKKKTEAEPLKATQEPAAKE